MMQKSNSLKSLMPEFQFYKNGLKPIILQTYPALTSHQFTSFFYKTEMNFKIPISTQPTVPDHQATTMFFACPETSFFFNRDSLRPNHFPSFISAIPFETH